MKQPGFEVRRKSEKVLDLMPSSPILTTRMVGCTHRTIETQWGIVVSASTFSLLGRVFPLPDSFEKSHPGDLNPAL